MHMKIIDLYVIFMRIKIRELMFMMFMRINIRLL